MDKVVREKMRKKVRKFLQKNIIGQNVRYYRQLRGYNQTQLKTAIQYQCRGHISKIENGRLLPGVGMQLLLAEALEIRPALLMLERNNVIDAFIFAIHHLPNGRQKTVVLEMLQKVLMDNSPLSVHETRGNRIEW